jgi:hypothetical protein
MSASVGEGEERHVTEEGAQREGEIRFAQRLL